ncbi:hypothetical protein N7528_006534 [Penicillium herquei]|nr:hypothetical protein N7528_006534 [Penicillium herquei]
MDEAQKRIISFIRDGSLSDLMPAVESALQKNKLPSTTILVQTAIETMQLDILQYLLTQLFQSENDKNHNEAGDKNQTGTLDRAVILETLTSERVPAFEVLCRHDSTLQTMQLGHFGTPLGWAILADNLQLASFLLSNGVDPNACQIHYRPAVVAAAGHGSCDMMELLLDNGAIIAGTDALFAAVRNKRIDMLNLLVKSRRVADINDIQPACGEKGLTPGPVLHLAIRRKYRQMVRVLINSFHVDPLIKDEEGKTALLWALDSEDSELVKMCSRGSKDASGY